MFKLSRVIGDIKAVGKKDAFVAPVDFDVRTVLPASAKEEGNTAIVGIRKGEAITLRANGMLISEGDSVDTYELLYDLVAPFLRRIIWYGDSVEIVEPVELRNQIVTLLSGFPR
jgi:proteasome accessory factor B